VHTNSAFKPKSALSAISTFFQSVGRDADIFLDKRASRVDELRRYRLLAVKFTDSGEDEVSALQFWSTYATGLLSLPFLARRFLSTSGTSVLSETAPSVSSFIGRKERCCLTPENLPGTMCLKDQLLTK
jgi:hypothetical protein